MRRPGPGGRILALDFGRQRIGVAVSDESRTIAQPHSTLLRRGDRSGPAEIARLCRELEVTEVVVGLPLQLDGTEGEAAREAKGLGAAVARASGLPVDYVDERLTSRQAERLLVAQGARRSRRRLVGDRVAAALILQQRLAAEPGGRG